MNIDSKDREPVWDYNLGAEKKARLYELSVFLFLIVSSLYRRQLSAASA
jgi:hypothetical protein